MGAGRSAWISGHASQLGVMRVVTRVSFFETAALGDNLREGAVMVIADAPIFTWLSVRGRGYAMQALPSAEPARSTPTLLMVDLSVTGSL